MKAEHLSAIRSLQQTTTVGMRPESMLASDLESFASALREQSGFDDASTNAAEVAQTGEFASKPTTEKRDDETNQRRDSEPLSNGLPPWMQVPGNLAPLGRGAPVLAVDAQASGGVVTTPPNQGEALGDGVGALNAPRADSPAEAVDGVVGDAPASPVDTASAAGLNTVEQHHAVASQVRGEQLRARAEAIERAADREISARTVAQFKGDLRPDGKDVPTANTSAVMHASTTALFGRTEAGSEGLLGVDPSAGAMAGTVGVAQPPERSAGMGADTSAGGDGHPSSSFGTSGNGSDGETRAGNGLASAAPVWADWLRSAVAQGVAQAASSGSTSWAAADAQTLGHDIQLWVSEQLQAADVRVDAGGTHPIDVRVVLQGRHAQVQVASEAPAVRDWLQRAAVQLEAALQAQGLALAGFEVSAHASWQGSSGSSESSDPSTLGAFASRRSAGSAKALPHGERSIEAVGVAPRGLAAEGRLDLFA